MLFVFRHPITHTRKIPSVAWHFFGVIWSRDRFTVVDQLALRPGFGFYQNIISVECVSIRVCNAVEYGLP